MALQFRRPRFTWRIIRQIVTCGTPTFLNNIAGRVTSILMNTVLLRVGGAAAVSVYGILMYADGIVMQFLYGMCDSLQPAVGYNWGAGRRDRVLAIEKRCFLAAAVLSVLASWCCSPSRGSSPACSCRIPSRRSTPWRSRPCACSV